MEKELPGRGLAKWSRGVAQDEVFGRFHIQLLAALVTN